MQEAVIHFVGAVLITYFLSRAFRRLVKLRSAVVGLLAPHVLSLIVVVLMLFLLRYPLYVFHKGQVTVYFVAQFLWLLFDAYRSGLAFWRPPVVETTVSSAKAPGASNR